MALLSGFRSFCGIGELVLEFCLVAGVFVATAIAGRLLALARNQHRLRMLRDEIMLETIDA
jgi:hypothetical protein